MDVGSPCRSDYRQSRRIYLYRSEVEGTTAVGGSFIEYEEGVYVGYKYYETADEMDASFDYDEAVVFPFGYGLSYTTFEQKVTGYVDGGMTKSA